MGRVGDVLDVVETSSALVPDRFGTHPKKFKDDIVRNGAETKKECVICIG